MRNTAALHWTLLVALLASPGCASAQSPTDVQESDDPTPSPTVTTISQYVQVGEYVREIFQDRDGNLWFSTRSGPCRYDGKSLTYLRVQEDLGWAVEEILQDENGAIWFGGWGPGVSRYEDGTFTDYTVASGLRRNGGWSMMLDSSGTIWVGTERGVYRFDGEAFIPFPIPRAEVENPDSNLSPLLAWGMAEDQDGNLWFCMDGEGVRKFNGESFTTYTTEDGLASNNLRSVYADRRGRVWFGTNDAGVSCYDGTAFRNFTEKDGLTSNAVWAILEDKAGNMWFSGNGATRYDGETFTAFPGDPSLTINGGPAHNGVMGMFEDRDGILWFGSTDGLWRLDGESFINVTKNGPWPVPPPQLLPDVELEGHTDHVWHAEISPDGSRIVTASRDGTARLWDIEGKPLAVLAGRTDEVRYAAFSPNGSRIITVSWHAARLWDSEGKLLAVLVSDMHGDLYAWFSSDGSRIVTGSDDGTVRLWDSEGNEVAVLAGRTRRCAAFSSDGSRIVTGSGDGTARLWDSDGKQVAVLAGHTSQVFYVGFSPDGSRILTDSFADREPLPGRHFPALPIQGVQRCSPGGPSARANRALRR